MVRNLDFWHENSYISYISGSRNPQFWRENSKDEFSKRWIFELKCVFWHSVRLVGGRLKQFDRHFLWWWFLPRILLMLELCISGQFFRILRRSSLAQIINAFMGRLMWGLLSLSFLGWRIILAPKTKIKWKTEFVLP